MTFNPGGTVLQQSNKRKNPFSLDNSPFTEKLNRIRYSPFSLEFKRIVPTQVFEYGQTFSLDIPVVGNLLYRSFFEIELPNLYFTDNMIDDMYYVEYKLNKLKKISNEIDFWSNKYNCFSTYASQQICVYSDIKRLLKLDNITLELINSKLYQYNIVDNLETADIYLYPINIVNSVQGITTFDINNINNIIDGVYSNIINNLEYFHSNMIYCKKEYEEILTGQILCKWIDYIGHFYFNYFELNINGLAIDNYSNDYLHIKQEQSIEIDYKENYNNLIGNTDRIYINKGSPNIIYTPLIFSYNNDSSDALPLIGMLNSSVKINSKINNIQNLVYCQDWEELYKNICTLDIKYKVCKGTNGIISKPNFIYEKVELIMPQYIYRYTLPYITMEGLTLKYPELDCNQVNILFEKYGSSNIIKIEDFIFFMNNIRLDTFLSIATKTILTGYHFYIDYNTIYNKIAKPKISLLVEYGYTDNYEKELIASNKLEYIIETHHEITLDVTDNSLYESLNDMNGLVKELYVFTRPKLNKYGLSLYGKKDNLFYMTNTDIIENINVNLASEYNLFQYYNTSIDTYNNVVSYYYLDAPLPLGVWYRTFSLEPTSIQPSGCINMNVITGQNVEVIVNDDYNLYYNSKINPNNLGIEFKLIYTTYNILKVNEGRLDLLFYE